MRQLDLISRYCFKRKYYWGAVILGLLCPLLLAGVFTLVKLRPSYAQTIPPATLDDFPLISVQVPCPELTQSITLEAFQLAEDGKTQSIQKVQQGQKPLAQRSLQIAIFIDFFRSIDKAAILSTGDRLEDLYHYTTTNPQQNTLVQFAVFAPLKPRELETVVPWTTDAARVVNTERNGDTKYPWQPKASDPTALIDLLLKTLDQFPDSGLAQRALVIFSDGTDADNYKNLAALVVAAKERRIAFYTVLLKDNYSKPEALASLAKATGGKSYSLSDLDRETTINEIWKPLLTPVTLCTLTYRTAQPHPSKVTVSQVISNKPYTTVFELPMIKLPPPEVTIALTAPGEIYPRTYLLAGAHPPTQTFDIQISWKFQKYERVVTNITYSIQGVTASETGTVSPVAGASSVLITKPVTSLPLGAYLVEATVGDEVGQFGQKSLAFGVAPTPVPTATPPPPTATPPPTPTALPTATPDFVHKVLGIPAAYPSTRWLLLLLLASFALPLLLLAFFLLRNYKRSPRFDPSPLTGQTQPIRALLSREELDDSAPTEDTWRLRQVVKLTNGSNRLPSCLYLKNRPANSKDELARFSGQIKENQGEFMLTPDPTVTAIRVKKKLDKQEKVVEGSIDLEDNDLILFDKIQYRFYKIKQQSDTVNGDADAI